MKIDFDNLRLRIGKNYNRLWLVVNSDIEEKEKIREIKNELFNLRYWIGGLLACELEKEDFFKAIDYKLLPNEDDEE